MSSPKQIEANRLNAGQSRGPQTLEGKKRSALNARKHGLSTPVQLSWQAVHVPEIAALLQAEGYGPQEAQDAAKCIVDFERNERHQRELMRRHDNGWLPKLDPQSAGQQGFRGLNEIQWFMRQRDATLSPSLKKMTQLLETMQLQQIKRDTQTAAHRLQCDERHHRRAANQLLKSLRRLLA